MYFILLLVCLPLTQQLSYQQLQSIPIESNFNEFKISENGSMVASMSSPSNINIHTLNNGIYHLSQILTFNELIRHF